MGGKENLVFLGRDYYQTSSFLLFVMLIDLTTYIQVKENFVSKLTLFVLKNSLCSSANDSHGAALFANF